MRISKSKNSSVVELAGLASHSSEQVRYFQQNKVYTLQIESTTACFLGCIYCYAQSNQHATASLTSNKIKQIINEAAELEIKMIDWLGGDPLLKDDWYELMKYTKDRKLKNNLWTSGVLLQDPSVAEKVVEATADGFVSVHLDSINKEVFNRLHRSEGDVIDKVLKGIDNLIALGKSEDDLLNCITYTNLQTPQDIKNTIRWFWEEKGIKTCLVLFKPAGCGNKMPDLKPSMDEIREVYEYRNKINYSGLSACLGSQDVHKFYCGTMFCVTFEGEITPCSLIRESVDSIYKRSLKEIIDAHLEDLIFIRLHDPQNLPVGCHRCPNNNVCWGCRASAWYYASCAQAADPTCWLNPEN